MTIDKRKKYIIVLDTETTNGLTVNGKTDLTQSLVYDLGWSLVDLQGNVYKNHSYAIAEIFLDKELMNSAYYAKKIPQYWEEIKTGDRQLVKFFTARRKFFEECFTYNVVAVCAHNASFDLRALNNTARLLTGSKCRFFYPRYIELWDSLKMARDIFSTLKGYKHFCIEHGYLTKHKIPQLRMTAEILYKYISGNYDFNEAHTGLEDVKIETEILLYCLNSHKKMRKLLFEN